MTRAIPNSDCARMLLPLCLCLRRARESCTLHSSANLQLDQAVRKKGMQRLVQLVTRLQLLQRNARLIQSEHAKHRNEGDLG